jgi:PST family polysaccharide transporter
MDIKQRTLRSLAVIYFFKFLWMGINFIRSVIIARLLFPQDFAIVALAFTFIYLVEQLFTFGFSKILIHKKNITEDEVNTAFTLNIIQNIIFFLIIYFGAPFVAAFYNKPVLDLVVKLLGFEVLMQCIGFIPRVMLQKEMRFKELESITFFSSILSTIILVVLAFFGFSFWSLVIASLTSRLAQSISFLFLSRINARLCLNKNIVRQYFKSGTIIYATAILTYFHSSIDTMLIGKISGLILLGYYTVAKEWARYFHNMLFAHLNNVLFPSYAYLQDDRPRLALAVKNVFRHAVPIMWPCYIGFLLIAPDFIQVFLGEKWIPAIFLLQILLFSMCFESIGWIFGPISDAIGRFDIRLKIVIFNVCVLALLFPSIGHFWGLPGYGAAVLCAAISSFILSFTLICKRELGLTWKGLWSSIRSVFFSILLMSVVLVGLREIFATSAASVRLFIMLSGGVCTYFLSFFILDRALFKEYWMLLRSLFIKKKVDSQKENQ